MINLKNLRDYKGLRPIETIRDSEIPQLKLF